MQAVAVSQSPSSPIVHLLASFRAIGRPKLSFRCALRRRAWNLIALTSCALQLLRVYVCVYVRVYIYIYICIYICEKRDCIKCAPSSVIAKIKKPKPKPESNMLRRAFAYIRNAFARTYVYIHTGSLCTCFSSQPVSHAWSVCIYICIICIMDRE